MVRLLSISMLFVALSIMQFCNCGYSNPKEENFSFSRMVYSGSEVRIDGYYKMVITDAPGVIRTSILFLNMNGIVLDGRSVFDSELVVMEERYKNGEYYSEVKDSRNVWGIFKISEQKITYEWWYTRNGGYQVIRYSGEIQNDTTIHFSSSERIDGSQHAAEDMTYHFKQFSPKPDSVVSFIP